MKFFSYLSQAEVRPASNKKVIPAKEFSLLVEAQILVEKALEEAEQKQRDTETLCISLKEQAQKEGFSEGLAQLNEKILHFDELMRNVRHEMNKKILPLALQAAKKIVGTELKTNPEVIVDIVLQALLPATQSHKVKIYVSKQDKEILDREKEKIRSILEQVQVLIIEEKEGLSPGGCIVETESGIINAEIENQWRVLERAFEKFAQRS